ncbi:hypothetical protein BN975_04070 [Mycolicibacterium farcinogenes]|uniref:Uncharacterized protein n=1 Tax=Mycolicibacterium senegalense TaxID=1796 RepID=A0A378SVN3_9MYCO|nr:hypothetical protein [Mycolicibacterium senegalense]CDP88237.1 hypothetical protein BN975_04070 [Mycolicibacterium farcinogenes]STZ51316.1 Uncharacterised protein [Mycolicibacterium senegalense]
MHGWATLPINSQYANYRDDVYRQLGIAADDDDTEPAVELRPSPSQLPVRA